jgi:Rrf2 family protein
MKIGEGVEWGLHCCAMLAVLPPDRTLPAARLAEFHDVAPAYLAKHLQALSRAGIVESVAGPRGGYRLARPAPEISVLDVVSALEGDDDAFRCTEIRQQGPCAGPPERYTKACGIAVTMAAAEAAWRSVLRTRTIADLVAGVVADSTPDQIEDVAVWLSDAMR